MIAGNVEVRVWSHVHVMAVLAVEVEAKHTILDAAPVVERVVEDHPVVQIYGLGFGIVGQQAILPPETESQVDTHCVSELVHQAEAEASETSVGRRL
jgi:hypothetical protein